jgi:membrane protease subunit HflK
MPGGNGEKDPWGQRRRGGGAPPDLDQLMRNFQRRLSRLFGGRGGSGFGIGLLVAIALGLWLLSGFYVVQQGERGVVLRFGALHDVTEAGLRWRFPYPIETVEIVDVEQVSVVEIGYRTNARGVGRSPVPREALMLTGDENIIHVEFAVQYRVKDAGNFLFNVRDPELTIAQATESSVREVVGRSTLDFALTEGRDRIARDARELLQDILDRYRTGIEVLALETQRAQPPDAVKPAFDDAVKAREDQQRLINEAQAYANDIIPRARGAAARLLEQAEAYRASTIARAEGDAQRFRQIAAEYAKAPEVTRQRLYIEALEHVLSNTTKVYIDREGGNNLLYLPLDRLRDARDDATPRRQAPPPAPDGNSAAPVRDSTRGRVDLRGRGQP